MSWCAKASIEYGSMGIGSGFLPSWFCTKVHKIVGLSLSRHISQVGYTGINLTWHNWPTDTVFIKISTGIKTHDLPPISAHSFWRILGKRRIMNPLATFNEDGKQCVGKLKSFLIWCWGASQQEEYIENFISQLWSTGIRTSASTQLKHIDSVNNSVSYNKLIRRGLGVII